MTSTRPDAAAHRDDPSPYRLSMPTLVEAREALQRLYGAGSEDVWQPLLQRAGLTGRETDEASLQRLLAVMAAADPVIALCGRALTIRATTYTHLSAAHALINSAQ